MRLRVTALPSFFVTVNPKRGPLPCFGVGDRSRISIRKAGVDERRPPRTARNSARALRVGRIGIIASAREGVHGCTSLGPGLGREALAAFGPAAGKNPLTTGGQHALAKAVTALANKAARLIRAFHGYLRSSLLAAPSARTSWQIAFVFRSLRKAVASG